MPRTALTERVAEAIYLASMSEQIRVDAPTIRAWKTDAPWDSQPDLELCEWERDEYRTMADAAIMTVLGDADD